MTVTTTNNKNEFVADGDTVDFYFTFTVQNADQIDVYVNKILSSGNDYTVTINPNGVGGRIRFTTAPADTLEVQIVRAVPQTQGTEIPTEADFPEKSITDMSDKLTMMIQDLQEQIDRCIKLPVTTTSAADLTLPEPEASKVLVFNSTADGLELVDRLESSGTGTGDATGPNGATTKSVAIFADTTGKLLKEVALGAAGTVPDGC